MDLLHLLLTTAPPGRNCRPCLEGDSLATSHSTHMAELVSAWIS